MEPGRLDRRVELQAPTHGFTDSWNQPTSTWSTTSTVWAHVKDMGAGEREENDQRVTVRRRQYTIRYTSTVSTQYRIKDDNDFYYITNVSRIGRDEGLVLTAEARDND